MLSVIPLPTTTDLVVWLKADEGVTNSTNDQAVYGDAVAGWVNVAAAGLGDAIQTSSGSRPTLVTDVVNGHPVVRFDGANDYMDIGTYEFGTSSVSAFAVMKRVNSNERRDWLFIDKLGAGGVAFGVTENSPDSAGVNFGHAGKDGTISNLTVDNQGFHIVAAQYDAVGHEVLFSLDSDTEIVAYDPNRNFPSTAYAVGQYFDLQFLQGDLAEMLIYQRNVGDGELENILSYLRNKYFETSTQVEIDVKAGSGSNSINVGSNGVIAVAIMTNADFDATQVNAASVIFAGAAAAHYAVEDVDHDGDLDMLLHFRTAETDLEAIYADLVADDINNDGILDSVDQETLATLSGETLAGAAIEGADSLNIFLRGRALRDLLADLFG
jgi:hypothetical protein